MTFTPDDLRCRYPEFEDTTEYPDDRVELFIYDAVDDIGSDPDHWGNEVRYYRALAALSAHYLVLAVQSEYGDISPAQAISSKKAGSVQITHTVGQISPKSDFETMLKSTIYGQQFLSLRNRSFVSTLVVPE